MTKYKVLFVLIGFAGRVVFQPLQFLYAENSGENNTNLVEQVLESVISEPEVLTGENSDTGMIDILSGESFSGLVDTNSSGFMQTGLLLSGDAFLQSGVSDSGFQLFSAELEDKETLIDSVFKGDGKDVLSLKDIKKFYECEKECENKNSLERVDIKDEQGLISFVKVKNSMTFEEDDNIDFPIILSDLDEKIKIYFPNFTELIVDGKKYSGVLNRPEVVTSFSEEGSENIQIQIGDEKRVELFDEKGEKKNVKVEVEIPQFLVGQQFDINSSEDGKNREFLGTGVAIDSGKVGILQFETYHFTQFTLGLSTGNFVINGDSDVATTTSVTLTNAITGATQMKFGNSVSARDATGWITYSGTYAWNLSTGDGLKYVYAAFRNGTNTVFVHDEIILSTVEAQQNSGLVRYVDGSNNGSTTFFDKSPNVYNATAFNGATGAIFSGKNILFTDGTNDYFENTNDPVTSYPFTMSAWIRPNSIVGQRVIFSIARSSSNNRYWSIATNGSSFSLIFRDAGGSDTIFNGGTAVVGRWYHVVGVFTSNTSKTLYVNGVSLGTSATNVNFSNNASNRLSIGRMGDSTPDRFFNGNIDEVRLYNRALTGGEISNLYNAQVSYSTLVTSDFTPDLFGGFDDNVATGIQLVISGVTYTGISYQTSGVRMLPGNSFGAGLATGTYNVRVNFSTIYGNTGSIMYTGGLIVGAKPTINYSTLSTTTNPVVATVVGLQSNTFVRNNNGSGVYTFTGNGSFVFEIEDSVGNVDYLTASVSNIYPLGTNFVLTAGGTQDDRGNGVAFDNVGNVFVGGTFRSSVNLFGFTGVAVGLDDVFLAKVDANGSGLFLVTGGSLLGDNLRKVKTDSLGNVYVMGNFSTGGTFFGSGISTTTQDVFVAKLSNTGSLLWIRNNGGAGTDDAWGFDVDDAGNSYIAGFYGGTTNMFGVGLGNSGSNDIFWAKLDTNGNTVWVRRGGGTGSDLALGIKVDSLGNVYSVGEFTNSANLAGIPLVSSGLKDVYLIKFDASGVTQWAKRAGGVGADTANGITTFGTNQIFVGGIYVGTGDLFGSTQISSGGSTDMFVTKLDSDGNFQSIITGGGVGFEDLFDLDADQFGNIYVGGQFQSTANIFGVNLVSAGTDEYFFAKLSNTLKRRGAFRGGGTLQEQGKSIDVNPYGYLASVGFYRSNPANFLGTNYPNNGGADVVLVKRFMGTPDASISYNITGSTPGPVIATLTGYSGAITVLNNGGSTGYTFTGNGSFTFEFQDSQGNIGEVTATVSWIFAGGLFVGGPTGFVYSTIGTVNSIGYNVDESFGDYFYVHDGVGSLSGYYTTIQSSTFITTGDTISSGNVYLQGTGITTLLGSGNAGVVVSTGLATFQALNNPVVYIKRDSGINSGIFGRYGNIPTLRVFIKPYQTIGTYSGTLTYTIYGN